MPTRFESEIEIPHPFYLGPKGFEHVIDLLEAASEGLLEDTRRCVRDGRAY
jgi:protein-tyrosine phosphatase